MASGCHDEFLELCALAAAGELSQSEQKKLSEHLASCSSCREAQGQYESLVAGTVSHLAAEEAEQNGDIVEPDASSSWSLEAAEADLFRRLANEESAQRGSEVPEEKLPDRPRPIAVDGTWRALWISYAAAILLMISLALAAYRGMRPSLNRSKPQVVSAVESPTQSALEQQISDLSHDRELARTSMVQRDKLIADLKRQLAQQSLDLAQLKEAETERQQEAGVRKSGQDLSFSRRQAELEEKLQQAEAEAQSLRAQLQTAEQESAQDSGLVATLQTKLDDLTRALQEKEGEVGQEKQLLAHDRDIRELMGARELYISEVYDVARSGETAKPFGRVFYTKEKSLVFYAYDLDQEAGVRNASAFQVWGRRGPDWTNALNLGIFFEDNTQKKHWVLKFNDPKTLAQIDAVFVTIEPEGGSRKPSGKPLLFAYLKMDPNHP
jgi:hypothetical protein